MFFDLAGIILEILSRNFVFVANFHTPNCPKLKTLVRKIKFPLFEPFFYKVHGFWTYNLLCLNKTIIFLIRFNRGIFCFSNKIFTFGD